MSCAGGLGELFGVATQQGEHTFIIVASVDRRVEAMRLPGKEAADLENPMSWGSAAELCVMMRKFWPERCNCHACRCRRENDYEAKALAEWEARPKRKVDWLGLVFLVMTFVRTKFLQGQVK